MKPNNTLHLPSNLGNLSLKPFDTKNLQPRYVYVFDGYANYLNYFHGKSQFLEDKGIIEIPVYGANIAPLSNLREAPVVFIEGTPVYPGDTLYDKCSSEFIVVEEEMDSEFLIQHFTTKKPLVKKSGWLLMERADAEQYVRMNGHNKVVPINFSTHIYATKEDVETLIKHLRYSNNPNPTQIFWEE